MRHVSLHDTIDTPSHKPTQTRLLDYSSTHHHTTGYEPLCLIGDPTINTSIFVFQVEVNIIMEKGLHKLSNYPAFPPCFWRRLLDVTHTVWETTITDNCDTKYNISLHDEFYYYHHHQVQWHELWTMGNQDGPTSRAEASVWYHNRRLLYSGMCSSSRVCAGICEGVSIVSCNETCRIDIRLIDD
jgi:hypothetical protein